MSKATGKSLSQNQSEESHTPSRQPAVASLPPAGTGCVQPVQGVGGRGRDAAVHSGESRRGSRSVVFPAVGVLRCSSHGTSAAGSEVNECVE